MNNIFVDAIYIIRKQLQYIEIKSLSDAIDDGLDICTGGIWGE